MRVNEQFVKDTIAELDDAFEKLEGVSRALKSDQVKELKSAGFDIDKVAADIAKFQRTFRLLCNRLNAPPDAPSPVN